MTLPDHERSKRAIISNIHSFYFIADILILLIYKNVRKKRPINVVSALRFLGESVYITVTLQLYSTYELWHDTAPMAIVSSISWKCIK